MNSTDEKDIFYLAHEDYVRNIVPLMLHYIWHWSKKNKTFSVTEMLEQHVDLWRKTVYYEDGDLPSTPGFSNNAWTEIRNALCNLFDRYEHQEDVEKSAMEYMWPILEPRLFKDSRPPRKNDDRPYGAWTITFRENNVLSVHIANVYRPDSIFDYSQDFATDLLFLIYDTCKQHPNLQTLFCGSWMNNIPPFQKFFPPEWIMNLHRPIYHNDTNGLWGQYVTRTGGFHAKNARRMQERGTHRYPLIHGQCSIASAITYLESEGWRSAQR